MSVSKEKTFVRRWLWPLVLLPVIFSCEGDDSRKSDWSRVDDPLADGGVPATVDGGDSDEPPSPDEEAERLRKMQMITLVGR